MYSLPARWTLRVDGAAAENRAEVEHVVLHPRAAVGRLDHVEAVDAARVVVVEPGGEHPRPPQFATVLVSDDVVGIVGPGAVIAEVSDRTARRETADEHAIVAVRQARGAIEHEVQIPLPQAPTLAVERVPHGRRLGDDERSAIELGQMDLDDPIADRVVEGRSDGLDRACQLRIRRRVHFDLIQLARRIGHPEAGLNARSLAPRDYPALEPDTVQLIRPSYHLFHAHRPPADAVREPARVRNFVDRVHVERAHVAPFAGLAERVDDEVVAVGVLDLPDLRRIEGADRRRPRSDRQDRSAASRRRVSRRRCTPRRARAGARRGRGGAIEARPSEDTSPDDVQVVAIATAKAGVDAQDDAVPGVEPEPDAVVALQPVEVRYPMRSSGVLPAS